MLSYLQPKSHSAIPTFDLVWRAALKSDCVARRRRLIMLSRAASHHNAVNKWTWSGPPPTDRFCLIEAAAMGNAAEQGGGFQAVRCEGCHRLALPPQGASRLPLEKHRLHPTQNFADGTQTSPSWAVPGE
jgi:hypothetical protein